MWTGRVPKPWQNRAYILTYPYGHKTCPCALAVVEIDLDHTTNHTPVCLARVPFEMATHARVSKPWQTCRVY